MADAGAAYPLGDAGLVKRRLSHELLPVLQYYVRPPREVVIELQVDAHGAISRAAVRAAGLAPRARRLLEQHVRAHTVYEGAAHEKRFVIPFSVEEIRRARHSPRFPWERIPRPLGVPEDPLK